MIQGIDIKLHLHVKFPVSFKSQLFCGLLMEHSVKRLSYGLVTIVFLCTSDLFCLEIYPNIYLFRSRLQIDSLMLFLS